ncbi:hypothetical protein DFH09DRAFT_1077548 [Mycena vulgaris]|nr:hypothetical protein DFH09DRAFT_1077548 [Mycena vulgaris]
MEWEDRPVLLLLLPLPAVALPHQLHLPHPLLPTQAHSAQPSKPSPQLQRETIDGANIEIGTGDPPLPLPLPRHSCCTYGPAMTGHIISRMCALVSADPGLPSTLATLPTPCTALRVGAAPGIEGIGHGYNRVAYRGGERVGMHRDDEDGATVIGSGAPTSSTSMKLPTLSAGVYTVVLDVPVLLISITVFLVASMYWCGTKGVGVGVCGTKGVGVGVPLQVSTSTHMRVGVRYWEGPRDWQCVEIVRPVEFTQNFNLMLKTTFSTAHGLQFPNRMAFPFGRRRQQPLERTHARATQIVDTPGDRRPQDSEAAVRYWYSQSA